MIKSKSVKIQLCFPEFFGKTKQAFVDAIVKNVSANQDIGYGGFLYKKWLHKHLIHRFYDSDISAYKLLTSPQRKEIEKIIHTTLKACFKKLASQAPVFVFVFPMLEPFDDHDTVMGFSSGFCPYKNVVHIYIAPDSFTSHALKSSVAHEYNHAIYFNHHELCQTLLETMIFEGHAENFEEELVGVKPPPYAMALSRKEAKDIFYVFKKNELNSIKQNLYQAVFFGSKKYKRWTGYSIGYWVVRSFLQKNPKKSWQEIIRMKPGDILNKSSFKKEKK